MVFGTLVYAVVLGFFDDYTEIFRTDSFSTVFFIAFVLEVLTYLTLYLKRFVAGWFRRRNKRFSNVGLFFGVWLVLFLSKFVFLEVVDIVFGDHVYFSGVLGIIAVLLTMSAVKGLIDITFRKLADT